MKCLSLVEANPDKTMGLSLVPVPKILTMLSSSTVADRVVL